MPDTEPTRYAESKVVPPPRTDVKFPEVAAIPPGQTSVVMIPNVPEVVLPKGNELPVREAKDNGVTSAPDIEK